MNNQDQHSAPANKDQAVEILTSILQRINAPDFSLKAIMETILDYVVEKTRADAGTILMKDDSEDALRVVALSGDRRTLKARPPVYPTNVGLQSIVFRTGELFVVSDVQQSHEYVECWPHALSEMVFPIKVEGRPVGVLTVDSRERSHFDNSHLSLLNALAAGVESALNMRKHWDMEEVRRIERELLAKDTVFVLMPFSEPFDKYYAAVIRPAVENCGLVPVRADQLFGPANVMRDSWAGIKNARLLVAELTSRNPNVMYEMGLAHAMEKPVILLTQSVGDVPFDLKSIRCIVYDTTNPDWARELRGAIGKHIEAIIREKRNRRFRPF
jgi:nucleoside 2-deoxyribosyltransferase